MNKQWLHNTDFDMLWNMRSKRGHFNFIKCFAHVGQLSVTLAAS